MDMGHSVMSLKLSTMGNGKIRNLSNQTSHDFVGVGLYIYDWFLFEPPYQYQLMIKATTVWHFMGNPAAP
jgi:hypothetical protein